jgi:hypothetical protein
MMFDLRAVGRWTQFLLLILSCAAMLTGCGKKQMAQVSGKVFYTDGSVPQGSVAVVRFMPTPDSTAAVRKAASGPIQPDGSFEMNTRKEGDGVYLGDYTVTFVVLRDGSNVNSSMILPKYNLATQTPFKITVDGNQDDLRYEIEPLPGVAAGAPAAEATGPGT